MTRPNEPTDWTGQSPGAADVAHQYALRASEILTAVHSGGVNATQVAVALAEANVSATLALYYQSLAAAMVDR